MPTRIDCEYEVLKAAGYPGTISEKELAWLQANGATAKNLPDAWDEFLTAQGQPPGGTLLDRRQNWLLGLIGVDPSIGGTWLDLWKAFWCEFGGDIGTPGGFSYDPFFTTPWGAVWEERGSVPGVDFLYAEADIFIPSFAEMKQLAPWVTAGKNVTYYFRLREAVEADTTFYVRIANGDDSSSVSQGSTTVFTGSVFGSFQEVATLPAGTGMQLVFQGEWVNGGEIYTNDFSGTAPNDLTGWEVTPSGFSPTGEGELLPITTQAGLSGGNLVALAPQQQFILYAPATFSVADVDYTLVLPQVKATNNVALFVRLDVTGKGVSFVLKSGGSAFEVYEWTPGPVALQPSTPVSTGDTVVLRMVTKGSQVYCYVDGALVAQVTTTVLAAGRIGVRNYLNEVSLILASGIQATSGGVHVESFAANVLEADGGPAQSLDPYFNTVSGNPWQVGTSGFSGNTATFGTSGNWLIQDLPNAAPGETWEVRAYLVKPDPAVPMTFSAGGTTGPQLHDGWNAFNVVMGPAAMSNIQINGGQTGLPAVVLHFFFAMKVG